MRPTWFGRLRWTLLALPLAMSGCIIEVLNGYSVISGNTKQIVAGFATVQLKSCGTATSPSLAVNVTCGYDAGGSIPAVAAIAAGGDGPGGLFEAIIDPVIVQLPVGYVVDNATYDADDGAGPQPLVVQTGLTSVPVTPGVDIHPEPGHQLMIFELPDEVAAGLPAANAPGKTFELAVQVNAEFPPGQVPTFVRLKALLALKIVLNGQAYYPPMFPCVTDFASVPSLQINSSGSLQNLLPAIATAVGQGAVQGCNGTVYDFIGGGSSTTSTTLPGGGGEVCDNCLDDDGDALVDREDGDCCAGGSSAANVRKVRLKSVDGGSRLRLSAEASGLDVGTPPSAQAIAVQLRSEAGGAPFCATVPAPNLRAKKKSLAFKDRSGAIAGGLSGLRVRSATGTTRVDASGKRILLATPEPGPFRVTIALPEREGGAQCASGTVTLTRRGKTVRFP